MLEDIVSVYEDSIFIKADGLDSAVLGVDTNSMRLIYSVSRCISLFIEQGMELDEAREYFEYNVRGAYVGEQTPIWCEDDF